MIRDICSTQPPLLVGCWVKSAFPRSRKAHRDRLTENTRKASVSCVITAIVGERGDQRRGLNGLPLTHPVHLKNWFPREGVHEHLCVTHLLVPAKSQRVPVPSVIEPLFPLICPWVVEAIWILEAVEEGDGLVREAK